MPIVTECTWLGCETLTIGPRCVKHEVRVERSFARGRAWPLPALLTSDELSVERGAAPSRRSLRRASAPLAAARLLR
jgi:hypothetical protein